MKWKDIFSLTGSKKNAKKAIKELDKLDTQVDGSKVTGGVRSTPELNWIEDAGFADPKSDG